MLAAVIPLLDTPCVGLIHSKRNGQKLSSQRTQREAEWITGEGVSGGQVSEVSGVSGVSGVSRFQSFKVLKLEFQEAAGCAES